MGILDKFRLDGRLALVTGAKHGIGKAVTLGLAEAGADIIGVSVTMEESGSELEREVSALARKFKGYQCDFGDRQATYRLISRLKAENPPIDILFSNAGTIFRKPAAEYPDDGWDNVIEVNLNSHFILSREIGKDMIARGSGKIIFTASMLTFQGGITVPAYSASKGGIGQLTKALANEWAKYGVNVNAIAPGYMATRLAENLRKDPVRNKAIVDRIPAGNWGEAEDLQGVVVFLASAASNYVHGAIINVDGGWLAR